MATYVCIGESKVEVPDHCIWSIPLKASLVSGIILFIIFYFILR